MIVQKSFHSSRIRYADEVHQIATDLAKAALTQREKHIDDCTRPLAEPKYEGFGTLFLIRIMLALLRYQMKNKNEGINTDEYAIPPTRLRTSTITIPTQRAEWERLPSCPVLSSSPHLAITLSMGRNKNVTGQAAIDRL